MHQILPEEFLTNRINSFNKFQSKHFEALKKYNKRVFQEPVGCGKGYLFMTDILHRVLKTNESIFTIASHRLILNDQHYRDIVKLFTPLAGEIIFINNSSSKFSDNLKYIIGNKVDFLDRLIIRLKSGTKYMNINFDNKEIVNILKEQEEYSEYATDEDDNLYNNNDISDYITYLIYKNNLLKKGIIFNKTVYNTTNPKYIREIIENFKDKKIIIISSYDSLWTLGKLYKGEHYGKKNYMAEDTPAVHINTIYCDEAHMLVTTKIKDKKDEKEALFRKNYETLDLRNSNKYFFTATPKENDDNDTNLFLLNNIEEFGEIDSVSFREAGEEGCIVTPYIHKIRPCDVTDFENNIVNRSKFILQGFFKHFEKVREMSSSTTIGAKLLVKCRNMSKDAIPIFNDLLQNVINVKTELKDMCICVGGNETKECYDENGQIKPNSKSQTKTYKIYEYVNNGKSQLELKVSYDYSKKDTEYLKHIQKKSLSRNVIVLHYDTLSEGINVNGFTGVMFMTDNLISEHKIIQNIGRASRLTLNDRKYLNLKNKLEHKNIENGNVIKRTWEKPFFAIIIPYWDETSGKSKESIEIIFNKLVEIGFKPRIMSSILDELVGDEDENKKRKLKKDENEDPYDKEFEHEITLRIKDKKTKIEEEILINTKKDILNNSELVEEYDNYRYFEGGEIADMYEWYLKVKQQLR